MGLAKKFDRASRSVYKRLRAFGKKYYLYNSAVQSTKTKLSYEQRRQVLEFYRPYFRPCMVYHDFYYDKTSKFDVRFIPDDVFSNVIDRYYNDSSRAVVLENKCYFEKMFPGVKQPEQIAYRLNNYWYISGNLVSLEEVHNAVRNKSVIIKQACGSSGGHSVFFVNCVNFDIFDETIFRIKEDIVVQYPIDQHEDLARINTSSVNTVRVLSLLNENGVKIYSCFLRCGRNGSIVDNTSSGGLACGINENGRLKADAFSRSDFGEAIYEHPDSGVIFEGYQIPSWNLIIDLVKKAHPQIPHFRMVSWDITVNSFGEPVLIEANLNDGLCRTHQVLNGPIFKDDTQAILKEVFGR